MQFYHIHLNGSKFVIECDNFILENGQAHFYKNGNVTHVAPKEALIINCHESIRAIEFLEATKDNIRRELSKAKGILEKCDNEESKKIWEYRVMFIEGFYKDNFDSYNSPLRAFQREIYGGDRF